MANGGFKIGRNRSGAQLPLALLAALSLALILIGKAQSNLFDNARAHVGDWMAPALRVARAPVNGIDHWFGSVGNYFHVYEDNQRLREENARLRQWHNTAVALDDRVKRYQLLLHAIPDPALSSVMAQVIGRANRPFLQTMILDAGRKQGIKPGQAVVDARGMVGRIFLAGQHTAWVILLTDLNSRIPVSIMPGNTPAILSGDNTSAPRLDLLSQTVTLKPGAQVISSGDGGLLPARLSIGTVVADAQGGYRVVLLSDPDASQDVNVVDFKQAVEQPPAVTPKDLPATAAGLPPAPPAPAMAHSAPVPPITLPPGVKPPGADAPAAPGQPAAAAPSDQDPVGRE
jgi:rod shape-determining protein MreC